MKCADCPYHWKEENEDFPCCHYGWNDGYAPCEADEPEETEDLD